MPFSPQRLPWPTSWSSGMQIVGPVADDVAELQAELDPAGGVLGVAVGLVAGEEEQVGVLPLEVLDDLGPQAGGAAGVARHVGDDDLLLVRRVAADEALEHRLLAVSHAVGHVPGVVPFSMRKCASQPGYSTSARAASVHWPSRWNSRRALRSSPGFKREELRGQLQHAGVMRVDREGDDLVARSVHRRCLRRAATLGLGLGLRAGFPLPGRGGLPGPPFPRGERFEIGILGAEWLRGVLCGDRTGSKCERAHSGGGEFDGGAAIDLLHGPLGSGLPHESRERG